MIDLPVIPTDVFYRRYVPKEPRANLRFRKWIIERCIAEPKFADEVWIACSRDILFFINAFSWLLEPRERAPWNPNRVFGDLKEIPFITRPYQDRYILQAKASLGKRDILVKKSRETGASWMFLYIADHEWRFGHQVHSGLLSRDEDTVLDTDDPDSLFSKLNFIDEHLPMFLRPERKLSSDVITNEETKSTITGSAAVPAAFRSGRKKFVMQDEMHFFPPAHEYTVQDSLRGVTHCRIMISTVNPTRGQGGAFFDACNDALAQFESIDIDWKDDAEKAAGLYTSEAGRVRILDAKYKFDPDYDFICDGKTRSPYYDYECRRVGATPNSIAAELDKSFGGAAAKFFDTHVIAEAVKDIQSPTNVCRFLLESKGEWVPQAKIDPAGDFLLWIPVQPDEDGTFAVPRDKHYSIGVDISAGTAGSQSSYSAFEVIDIETGEQIGEWRGNTIKPDLLANFSVAVAKFFNNAVLCPEVTGTVGQLYLTQLLQLDYSNLYLRPSSEESVEIKWTIRVGVKNTDGGERILGELQRAMRAKEFTPRSQQLVKELERYYYADGKLKHPLVGKGRENAPERSHGDCAIACACAWQACRDLPIARPEEAAEKAKPDTWLYSWQQHKRSERKARGWWNPLTSDGSSLVDSGAYPEEKPVAVPSEDLR